MKKYDTQNRTHCELLNSFLNFIKIRDQHCIPFLEFLSNTSVKRYQKYACQTTFADVVFMSDNCCDKWCTV